MKRTKIACWVATLIFALLMVMDGIGGITRQEAGVEVMKLLGYPIYFLSISGIAKILGAVAIVQNHFKTIKEWAYAGVAVNLYGASMSWFFAGGGAFEMVFPIIVFGMMLIPYLLWKKMERSQLTSA